VAGVSEAKGKVAVVGEQQRPSAVGIEPADGVNADVVQVRGQGAEYGGAALRVGTGGNHAQGFVKQQIVLDRAMVSLDRLMVDLNAIALGVGSLAQVGDGSIDLHLPSRN
jgi:hypothetical protein